MDPTYIIPSALPERAGWTATRVRRLPGEPGQRKKGPGRTRLWTRVAVTCIKPAESTADFVPARAGGAQRKKALAAMQADPVNAA